MPIPLGGIAIRRELPKEIISRVETGIRKSIEYAHRNPEEADAYIKAHAQEMSGDVISQHINLYVNDFSTDIGDQGTAAIETLFAKARKNGIIPDSDKDLFACEDNN